MDWLASATHECFAKSLWLAIVGATCALAVAMLALAVLYRRSRRRLGLHDARPPYRMLGGGAILAGAAVLFTAWWLRQTMRVCFDQGLWFGIQLGIGVLAAACGIFAALWNRERTRTRPR